MTSYDFNNLEDMLKNGASDADIARAFTTALNSAKAADSKRRVEEAEAKKREAERLAAEAKKNDARKAKAQAAADAMNEFVRSEGLPLDKDTCFTADNLIEIIDSAKDALNAFGIGNLLKTLSGDPLTSSKLTSSKLKDNKAIKPRSDEDIIEDFLNSIFR